MHPSFATKPTHSTNVSVKRLETAKRLFLNYPSEQTVQHIIENEKYRLRSRKMEPAHSTWRDTDDSADYDPTKEGEQSGKRRLVISDNQTEHAAKRLKSDSAEESALNEYAMDKSAIGEVASEEKPVSSAFLSSLPMLLEDHDHVNEQDDMDLNMGHQQPSDQEQIYVAEKAEGDGLQSCSDPECKPMGLKLEKNTSQDEPKTNSGKENFGEDSSSSLYSPEGRSKGKQVSAIGPQLPKDFGCESPKIQWSKDGPQHHEVTVGVDERQGERPGCQDVAPEDQWNHQKERAEGESDKPDGPKSNLSTVNKKSKEKEKHTAEEGKPVGTAQESVKVENDVSREDTSEAKEHKDTVAEPQQPEAADHYQPARLNHIPKQSEPCSWCSNIAYGLVGFDRHRPGQMCSPCAQRRMSIIKCPAHQTTPLEGLSPKSFDFKVAYDSLVLVSGERIQGHAWCDLCPAPAFFQCATQAGTGASAVMGCGLLLCETCNILVQAYNNLALVVTINRSEDPQDGSRADVGYLLPGSEFSKQ
ncbi:hypothetical protein BJX76DRAFT_356116 [Aspergillus varians]